MRKAENIVEEIVQLVIVFLKWLYARIFKLKNDNAVFFKYKMVPCEFLTAREKSVYKVLFKVARSCKLHLMSKCRLIDVVHTDKRVPYEDRNPQDMRIIQQHLDFVFVDMRKNQAVLAVEVDDKSHGSDRQQERDAKKDEALESAGVKLLRVEPGKIDFPLLENKVGKLLEEPPLPVEFASTHHA